MSLTNNLVTLSWNQPAEGTDTLTGYEILRQKTPGESALTTLTADTGSTSTTYTDTTANEPAKTYTYRVKAIRGTETSPQSNDASYTLPDDYVPPGQEPEQEDPPVPEPTPTLTPAKKQAPQNLTLSAQENGVTLTWEPPLDDAESVTSYRVMRRRPNEGENQLLVWVSDTGSTATSHLDGYASESEQTYIYRVIALRGDKVSKWSNSAEITRPANQAKMAPVLTLSLQKVVDGTTVDVTIEWNAPQEDSDSVTGYQVQRAVNNQIFTAIVQDTGDTKTTYTDTAVSPPKTHSYRVLALRGTEESIPSNVLEIKTQLGPQERKGDDDHTSRSIVIDIGLTVTSNSRTTATAVYAVTSAGTYYLRHAPAGTTDWSSTIAQAAAASVTFSLTGLEANARYEVEASDSSTFPSATTIGGPFTNRPNDKDFALDAGNSEPTGIALSNDGNTVWVTDASSSDGKAYAYNVSDGTQNTSKTFDLDAANTDPAGAAIDQPRLLVVDSEDLKVYAYLIFEDPVGDHDAAGDFDLHPENASPTGIWTTPRYAYVADGDQNRIFVYLKATGERQPDFEFEMGEGDDVQGIWAGNETALYTADAGSSEVKAYKGSHGRHYRAAEFPLEEGDNAPKGVTGSSDYIWIPTSGEDGEQVQVYYAPDPPETAVVGLLTAISFSSVTVLVGIGYQQAEARNYYVRYRQDTEEGYRNLKKENSAQTAELFTMTGLKPDRTYTVEVSLSNGFRDDETDKARFTTRPHRHDITLAPENSAPRGITGAPPEILVVNAGEGNNRRVYGYYTTVRQRETTIEFALDPDDNPSPTGIHVSGTTAYVADGVRYRTRAYDLTTGTTYGDRDSTKDVVLDDQTGLLTHIGSRGTWSDGDTIWTIGHNREHVYAHNVSSTGTYGERQTAKECGLATAYAAPTGTWSDGTTIWVADSEERRIFAYTMGSNGCSNRDMRKEIRLADGNDHPWGIWSDGTVMWVADTEDRKLYAYFLPPEPTQGIHGVSVEQTELTKANIKVDFRDTYGSQTSGRLWYHKPPISNEADGYRAKSVSGTSYTYVLDRLSPDTHHLARVNFKNRGEVQFGFRTIGEEDLVKRALKAAVEAHEDDHPWVREAYNGMRHSSVPVSALDQNPSGVRWNCEDDRCVITALELNNADVDDEDAIINTLAHVYIRGRDFVDPPTEYLGAGWPYLRQLTWDKPNPADCDIAGLYADTIQLATSGGDTSHFASCSLDATEQAEAQTVIGALLQRGFPANFDEIYSADGLPYRTSDQERYDADYDLEKLYTHIKRLWNDNYTTAVNQFQQAFGGFCPNYGLDHSRNPWQAGGCLPTAPDVELTGLGADGIRLEWTTPGYDGGSPIKNFLIEWHPDGGSFESATAVDPGQERIYTLTGVPAGATLRLTAHNREGPSQPVVFQDPGEPEEPALVAEPSDGDIALAWIIPPRWPTWYIVEWKTEDADWESAANTAISGDGIDTYIILGLDNNVPYTARVTAKTLFGFTRTSHEVTVTPSYISQPRNLAYTTRTISQGTTRRCQEGSETSCVENVPWWHAQVTLTWHAPERPGPLHVYRIERKNSALWHRPLQRTIDPDTGEFAQVEAPNTTELTFTDVGPLGSGIYFTGMPGDDYLKPIIHTYRITPLDANGKAGHPAEITLQWKPLVVHQFWIDGYKDFNFMRASAVVKRQSTFMAS